MRAGHLLELLSGSGAGSVLGSSVGQHDPHPKAAETNAFAFFNSIHSAMRQFGSSVHHNGMSFFLAQAPKGSLFYHGALSPETPKTFEWLAFEFEHAGAFAQSWESRNETNSSLDAESLPMTSLDDLFQRHRMPRILSARSSPLAHLSESHGPAQQPLSGTAQDKDDDKAPALPWPRDGQAMRGYLHFYRANRPLNLLYIDGEAAAKCALGPMDSQDLLLLDQEREDNGFDDLMRNEYERARGMCKLAEDWASPSGAKIDGFVRMEAGFEIIYCDWSPSRGGIDQVSVQASPFRNETGVADRPANSGSISAFEMLRAATQRFHGHPAGRIDVDWSSMVSAFAYPVNLSNANIERQDLPRLTSTTRPERDNIRARLKEVIRERMGKSTTETSVVNWQAVADKIVTRFGDRLWSMAHAEQASWELMDTISTLIDPFVDYLDGSPMAEQSAMARCAQHFDPQLLHPRSWTPEDHAIAAAIGAVSSAICTSLFSARRILRSNGTERESSGDDEARMVIKELVEGLSWSTWRECQRCGPKEICSIPMFPSGSVEDYTHPTCKNVTQLRDSFGEYWGIRSR